MDTLVSAAQSLRIIANANAYVLLRLDAAMALSMQGFERPGCEIPEASGSLRSSNAGRPRSHASACVTSRYSAVRQESAFRVHPCAVVRSKDVTKGERQERGP